MVEKILKKYKTADEVCLDVWALLISNCVCSNH